MFETMLSQTQGCIHTKTPIAQKLLVERWEFGYNERTARYLSNTFSKVLV